jgi:hypothetical protein
LTTLLLSAPKKIRSPDCAPVRSTMVFSADGVQVLDDRRLQTGLVELRDVIDLDVGQAAAP